MFKVGDIVSIHTCDDLGKILNASEKAELGYRDSGCYGITKSEINHLSELELTIRSVSDEHHVAFVNSMYWFHTKMIKQQNRMRVKL